MLKINSCMERYSQVFKMQKEGQKLSKEVQNGEYDPIFLLSYLGWKTCHMSQPQAQLLRFSFSNN